MTEAPLARILIVDDEAAQMNALCDTLTMEGYATTGFSAGQKALEVLREQEFDLLLTDLMMPEIDGIELLRSAREIAPDLVGIMMTGHGTIDTAVKAMQAGALDYIVKPFRLNVILPVLNRALAVRRLRLENAQLAQSVRQRTRELENANRQLELVNKELESFSYSVSHDCGRRCARCKASAGSIWMISARAFRRRVWSCSTTCSQAASAWAQLIEDLLEFSRLGRQPILRQIVPLDRIVARLVAEQREKDPQRPIELRVGSLGECEGDPSLIEQVLVNLISNAFKFTRGRDPAVVEIDRTQREAELVYFVRDNGAGFDMKYADKLFGVFQRLHTTAQFEGTGVGLSIVHRIVDRHGGRIWAESEPEKGAAFFFTLPSEPS